MIKRRNSNNTDASTNLYLVSYYYSPFKHPLSKIVEWDGITRANIVKFEKSEGQGITVSVYILAITKLDKK